jgi:hypothetical protein
MDVEGSDYDLFKILIRNLPGEADSLSPSLGLNHVHSEYETRVLSFGLRRSLIWAVAVLTRNRQFFILNYIQCAYSSKFSLISTTRLTRHLLLNLERTYTEFTLILILLHHFRYLLEIQFLLKVFPHEAKKPPCHVARAIRVR